MRKNNIKHGFKKIALTCAALCMCVAAAGCGKSGGGTKKELTLKAGFSTAASDPRVVATEHFKEEVEKATEGRIKIEIHTDGELGSDSDLISGVVNGTVDITASSAGNFATYDANVGISAFPFLFDSFEDAWEFVESKTEEEAEKGLANYNIEVLSHFDNGFRCVTTSEKAGEVNSVSDMEGLKIRTPENQIVMTTMQALGAKPEVLGFAELYDALKTGKFDAQENPIPVIYNNKLYEVQKNLAITNHSYDAMLFVINKEVWDELSPEDQQIIYDAAQKAEKEDRDMIKQQTEDYIAKLEEAGMKVTYPDLEEFKEATSSVADSFAGKYDKELLQKIKEQ